MSDYFDLHRHNHMSHDAIHTEEECAAQAKRNGYKALGISNHGTIDNIRQHIEECRRNDIKPIAGAEIYLQAYADSKPSHLCLFCKNRQGYDNLVQMFAESIAVNNKRVIPFATLAKYHDGLICTTACLASEIGRELLRNRFGAAGKMLSRLKSLFYDDLYIEIIPYNCDNHGTQRRVNMQLMHLAECYGVKCIITSDSHACYRRNNYRCMPNAHDIYKRFATMFHGVPSASYSTYLDMLDNLDELAGKVSYFAI